MMYSPAAMLLESLRNGPTVLLVGPAAECHTDACSFSFEVARLSRPPTARALGVAHALLENSTARAHITWPASHPTMSTNQKKHHTTCIHSHACGLCPQLGGSPPQATVGGSGGEGHGEAPPVQGSWGIRTPFQHINSEGCGQELNGIDTWHGGPAEMGWGSRGPRGWVPAPP